MISTSKKLIAEFIGTFLLVFIGCGAVVLDTAMGGKLGVFGIAVAWGLIVYLMILAYRFVSGAHINSGVTVAFFISGHIEKNEALSYLVVQILGALGGAFALKLISPTHPTLGATLPSIDIAWTFIIEMGMSFLLMASIYWVINSKIHKHTDLVVGFVIFLEAFFAGPYTGASMNPARSIGPALISGQTQHLWLYIAAPLTGTILAAILFRIIRWNTK